MIGPFEELLHALGRVFHLELTRDKHNACSIQMHEGLIVQLQLDESQENLWIFSKLIDIPPGKFRENVLLEALRANGLPDPLPGYLGYIAKENMLALFQKYPLHILNGERLAGLIGSFFETAVAWRVAVSNGKPGPTWK